MEKERNNIKDIKKIARQNANFLEIKFLENEEKLKINFRCAYWGPRARLRTLDLSTRPLIDMNINFPLCVSAESPLNISPNLSEVISEVSEP
jgi:hypothetical protein